MTVARSVSDVLDDHVRLEVECIDRMVRHEALVRREALETEGGVTPPRRAVAAGRWELSAV